MKHLLITIAAVVLVGCGGPPEVDRALHKAAGAGNIEAVKQHLAAGADVNAQGVDGITPLDQAILDKQTETADLLRKHGGKRGAVYSIHVAAKGDIEAVKQHLAAGVDVNAKSDDGGTPLLYAAAYGHKKIVELLIAAGADVNVKNENGKTTLHFAVLNGRKVIGELLIAKGADVNAKDEDGKTPLDATYVFNKTETADLLRKHGGKTAEELKAEGK
jgi:ankyrin repeat protein